MSMTRKGFLGLGAAAAVAGAVKPGPIQARTPRRDGARLLLRGGDLLTMDPAIGERTATDLLIENGRIKAMGADLPSDGCEVIDARGKILMPGMIDGHRHVWQTVLNGVLPRMSPRYGDYDRQANMTYALAFAPDEMYHAQYVGGLTCLDSGVTSVIDQMHAANGDDMEDAAARGLKDSGVAGVFCYQMRNGPFYTVGQTYPYGRALVDRNQPPDERHWRNAERIRDRHFSSDDSLLGFGIGLTGSIGTQTVEQAAAEFRRARALSPRLLTQHMNQKDGAQPPIMRGVGDLNAEGLLGPDYLISHGVDVTDEELLMLRDSGSGVCSAAMGEIPYPRPSIHGRARAAGVGAAIGLDVSIGLTHDFFEHVRAGYWNLFKSPPGAAMATDYEPTDILDFATRSGARAIGLGDVTGTLTAGKRADVLMLRTDRFGFSKLGGLADRVVTSAGQQDIESVWVAGRTVKSGGKLVGVDLGAVERRSVAVRDNVLRRAAAITLS